MGYSFFDRGFNAMFTIVPVIVSVGFAVVIGMILFTAVRAATEWNKNNHSPTLTVSGKVVAKRIAVSNHHHQGHGSSMSHHSSSTTYFTTFEVESGDRIELTVPGREYGLLAEGDDGRLTFQGTRYKGFEREIRA